MGSATTGFLQLHQTDVVLTWSCCTLLYQQASSTHLWRLTLRCWCCAGTPHGGWLRKTDHLPLQVFIGQWEKLCPDWSWSFGDHLRTDEVQPVHLGPSGDHRHWSQAVVGLLGPNKPVPQMMSPRMQRWAFKLSSFEYDLVYRPGPSIPEADALSRLPAGPAPINVPVPGDTIHIMQHMDMSPVTFADVRKETARDPVLSQVYLWVQSGYPDVCNEDKLRPYFQRRSELSIHDGCFKWGARVVIPPVLQDKVLAELHEGHPGVVHAKAVARSLFWWPGIDKAIEDSVKSCDACMLSRHKPPKAPLHPWVFPDRPW